MFVLFHSLSSKKNIENVVENFDTNSDKNEAKPDEVDISDESKTDEVDISDESKTDEVDISDESKTDEFTNGMNQVLCSELRTIVVLVYLS